MPKPIDIGELSRLLDEQASRLALYASQWAWSPDDCVQEAFVSLAAQIPPPAKPVAWLFRVVRNAALNQQRAEQRRSKYERQTEQPEFTSLSESPVARLEQAEQNRVLWRSLKQLEGSRREVVVLRIWSGLTWQEIAELTGSSSSSTQRTYVAALEQLKTLMESSCATKLK